MRLALTLLLLCSLSACGGGGDDCTPKVVRIQLFGDSTQWGMLAKGGGVRAAVYPELALQKAMDGRFGPGTVVVSTRAVSGTTSSMLLAGTDGLNKPWPQSVDAEIVVINHGINDVGLQITPETYASNLRALSKAPAIVAFETPLPVNAPVPDYSPIMRSVAAEVKAPLIDVRAYVQSLPDWWIYSTDGVHATDAGYQVIVSGSLFPALAPMVAPMRCQ